MSNEIMTINAAPRKSLERLSLAKYLRAVRRDERTCGYPLNRDGKLYLEQFYGLDAFMKYTSTLGETQEIMDIGAWTATGICNLAAYYHDRYPKFTYTATVLTDPKKLYPIISEIHGLKIRRTCAEVLRDIPNQSVGGILAMTSIAFSILPEMVIRRIDQVLIPGGAIKATFYPMSVEQNNSNFQSHNRFTDELKHLGYDVDYRRLGILMVLVAVKPGANRSNVATQLLSEDANSRGKQLAKYLYHPAGISNWMKSL